MLSIRHARSCLALSLVAVCTAASSAAHSQVLSPNLIYTTIQRRQL